jgi:hypothetical protein
MAPLSSFRYISFSLLGPGPLPHEARAPAGLGADQGCGPAGNPAARQLNHTSSLTQILEAPGQASHHVRKMLRAGGCRDLAPIALVSPAAANDRPEGARDPS